MLVSLSCTGAKPSRGISIFEVFRRYGRGGLELGVRLVPHRVRTRLPILDRSTLR